MKCKRSTMSKSSTFEDMMIEHGRSAASREPKCLFLPGAMQQSSGHIRHRHTIRSVLASTVRSEGIPGLYKGIGPTLFGILPYAGLKFYVYQSLKQQYRM